MALFFLLGAIQGLICCKYWCKPLTAQRKAINQASSFCYLYILYHRGSLGFDIPSDSGVGLGNLLKESVKITQSEFKVRERGREGDRALGLQCCTQEVKYSQMNICTDLHHRGSSLLCS